MRLLLNNGIAKVAGSIAALLLSVSALGQSADITGWLDLPWGTQKPAALKTLQSRGAHEAVADVVLIENYRLDGVSYRVDLIFIPKYGLGKVTMTAHDEQDVFQRILSQLTARYGKPGLQSEYDGVQELTRTTWTWLKPHGKLSLDSEETEGTLAITYEARR